MRVICAFLQSPKYAILASNLNLAAEINSQWLFFLSTIESYVLRLKYCVTEGPRQYFCYKTISIQTSFLLRIGFQRLL